MARVGKTTPTRFITTEQQSLDGAADLLTLRHVLSVDEVHTMGV